MEHIQDKIEAHTIEIREVLAKNQKILGELLNEILNAKDFSSLEEAKFFFEYNTYEVIREVSFAAFREICKL